MMDDKQTVAVDRYRAMAGLTKNLTPKAARRAKRDRQLYGERYVARRGERVMCDPLRTVRFLVEVCGLTLKDASAAVRGAIRAGGCGPAPKAKDAQAMARRLYRDARDVLQAVAMARFFGWASDDPASWEAVRDILTTTPLAKSTGEEG